MVKGGEYTRLINSWISELGFWKHLIIRRDNNLKYRYLYYRFEVFKTKVRV